MPCRDETMMYARHCVVVFGYNMIVAEKEFESEGEKKFQSPTFSFPNDLPQAIEDFMKIFQAEYQSGEKKRASSYEGAPKLENEPELVQFVR